MYTFISYCHLYIFLVYSYPTGTTSKHFQSFILGLRYAKTLLRYAIIVTL